MGQSTNTGRFFQLHILRDSFMSYEGRFRRHILVRAPVLITAIGRTRGIIEFCGLAIEIKWFDLRDSPPESVARNTSWPHSGILVLRSFNLYWPNWTPVLI